MHACRCSAASRDAALPSAHSACATRCAVTARKPLNMKVGWIRPRTAGSAATAFAMSPTTPRSTAGRSSTSCIVSPSAPEWPGRHSRVLRMPEIASTSPPLSSTYCRAIGPASGESTTDVASACSDSKMSSETLRTSASVARRADRWKVRSAASIGYGAALPDVLPSRRERSAPAASEHGPRSAPAAARDGNPPTLIATSQRGCRRRGSAGGDFATRSGLATSRPRDAYSIGRASSGPLPSSESESPGWPPPSSSGGGPSSARRMRW